MPEVGVEPTRGCPRWILSPVRLPISPLRRKSGLYNTIRFFVKDDSSVIVNEIAPRVHNSGHFSQDTATTSQFKNHWLGLLGRNLGSTQTTPFFGMINILGEQHIQNPKPFYLNEKGITSHWYGKMESRPDRKLGHVNVEADTPARLEQRLETVKTAIKNWHKSL